MTKNTAIMSKTVEILGEQAGYYLSHVCRTIDKKSLYLPGPDTVDRIWAESDRSVRTLGSLQWILSNGRLGGTGYVSILPVDQGIEHSAGASFAPNPAYFDPENIVRLAVEGGCNAVASTFGVLGAVARKYAHKIPFIVKINHNELLSYPNTYDQVLFGTVRDAWNMGAAAVGATIYFGSPESRRQLVEIARAFDLAHELGMATILWCYLRNEGFRKEGADYHASADLTGQADHLGVTIKADIVKQKLPSNNGGFRAVGFGKTSDKVYVVGALLHPGALGADGRHVQLHDPEQVFAHGPDFGFGDRVAQRSDVAFERRGGLLLADLGDVLLLQGEVFAQGVPRYGILPDVVERPQHLPGVLQRVVVVGEDGSRRPRQLADVADRLDAQQQDHGEKNADAQGDSPLYSHGL